VRKRRVFYLPGYDPFHPRRYRELYRKECAAQAAISGYEIGIKPRLRIPTYPPTNSANIRPVVPGYPPTFDALP